MRSLHLSVLCIALLAWSTQASAADGRKIYESVCAGCHNSGLIGSPKLSAKADWEPRLKKGAAAIYTNALKGTPRGMPPKGGKSELSDGDVRAAVDYMVAQVGGMPKTVEKQAPAKQPVAETKPTPPPVPVAATPPPPSRPTEVTPPPAVVGMQALRVPVADADSGDVNSFNRLLRPPGQRNLPPAQDGIHDPANDGTHALQPPRLSFGSLPPANSGNRVDWVAALNSSRINPRWDRNDANAQPVIMDLNIVREVKVSMPDVVYPHKQHTQWLDCSNCHPSIFVPQKGANQISMASILLGQACGVCHGKVAFPVSECRLCHSKKKDSPTAAVATGSNKP